MRYIILIIWIGLLPFIKVFGQGCSNAGACSIGSVNGYEDVAGDKSKVRFGMEQSFGLGEKFIFISQSTAAIQYRVFKTTSIELRIPFVFTVGNLGQTAGVGDMLLSVNQKLFSKNKSQFDLLIAGRLKSNNSDFTFDGNPLPMAYQTSLGTNDAIIGLLFSIPAWDFYSAYQHPFGRNKNEYLVTDPALPDNKKYYESAQLKRGDDLYFRIRYQLQLKNENSILLTLLGIYRLQEDEIIKNDLPVLLEGSRGITINTGFTWSRKLKRGQTMDLQLSFPVIDRAYRADGLTRNVVLSLRLSNL